MHRSIRLAAPLAGTLLFFGLVSASADGPATVVHACRNGDHTVRLVDSAASCHDGETVVEWNVTGPAGPAGAAGSDGAVGPQGERGPSDYFDARQPDVSDDGFANGSEIFGLDLPAGNFAVTFKADLSAPNQSSGSCTLNTPSVAPDFIDRTGFTFFPGDPGPQHFSMQGPLSLAAPARVSVSCTGFASGAVSLSHPVLSALAVSTLHDTDLRP